MFSVWLDESVGPDESEALGAPEQLDIQVEGHDYAADLNYDLDHDGLDDSARIEHEDGSVVVYTDTDHDGHADEYLHVGADGSVMESAHFDPAAGQWTASEPPASAAAAAAVANTANAGMTSDLHGQPVTVGPATVDSDNDGQNDTAVVQNGEVTELLTDTDHDGKADVDTVIDKTGTAVTYERGADGHWTESTAHQDPQQPAPADSDTAWGDTGQEAPRWV